MRLGPLGRAIGLTVLSYWGGGQHALAQESLQPEGWDANIRLAEATDTNPDPHLVEVHLDARIALVEIEPGRRVEAWTYNGGIPGPLIRVRVGDRLVVRFTNHLPKPTTVHWHGLRVPIQMDGVPGASQPEVRPGESFTYDFVVPDAGLFWYHPHVMSATQVGFGLYGALLVEDPTEHVGVSDQLVLVLSDIALDEEGVLEEANSGGSAGMVFGREGNYVLVNGRVRSRLTARSGVPQRWRVVNAAKSRHFQIHLGGPRFTTIGGDGGLLEYPVQSETLILAAGERADVIVTPEGATGAELIAEQIPYNRGYGSIEYRSIDELFTIKIADLPAHVSPPLPPIRGSIEALSLAGATEVSIDFTLARLADGSFEYGIGGVPFAKGKPLKAQPGETQVWTVTNKTAWSHPFHLHGFFFQVLDDQGAPVRPLAWKDTVNVPLEKSVRLLVRFDDRQGSWMYHCHILDHADGGLMGWVEVGIVTAYPEHRHPER